MSIGSLLFSAKGRISQKTFWLSYGPIFVVSTALSFVSRSNMDNRPLGLLVLLVALLTLYPSICLYAKRLHDMGFSGWMQLILYAASLAFVVVIASRSFGAGIAAAMEHQGDPAAQQAAAREVTQNLMQSDPVMKFSPYIGLAISAVWTLWLGLTPGNSGDNKYGAPEGTAVIQTSVV